METLTEREATLLLDCIRGIRAMYKFGVVTFNGYTIEDLETIIKKLIQNSDNDCTTCKFRMDHHASENCRDCREQVSKIYFKNWVSK